MHGLKLAKKCKTWTHTPPPTYPPAARRYWPEVEESKLVPDYSGIRPKLVGPEGGGASKGGAADFEIQGSASHGVAGLVNLLGIESPGLTASMAIAEHVAKLVELEAPP